MTIQMASVGVVSAIGAGLLVIELDDIVTPLISGIPFGGGFLPRCSYRMDSSGEGQTATGDSGAALVYAQFGNDWLISGLNSLFECEFIETSVSGDAGTLTGSALNVFQVLSASRTIVWEKDTSLSGSAFWNGTIEIREIATPLNTTGPVVVQTEATVL